MHRGSGLEESSLSSGRPSKDIGLTTLIDLVEVGDITEIVIMATVTPVRIVRTTQVEAHLQVVVAVTRQAVAQILQSVRSIGLSGMTKIETTMEMAFKTRRTSTTSSTTTIPTVSQEQFIQQEWRYETCWFDDGDLGAPIVLQLRNAKGEWKDVKAPTARTTLKRFETVENTKCTPDRPHSAVTTWAPSEPGVYYLRHYYVGFKSITTGFPYEEIIVLVVR